MPQKNAPRNKHKAKESKTAKEIKDKLQGSGYIVPPWRCAGCGLPFTQHVAGDDGLWGVPGKGTCVTLARIRYPELYANGHNPHAHVDEEADFSTAQRFLTVDAPPASDRRSR